MSYVNFNRQKNLEFATSADADSNTIYFTSDTHEIIIQGNIYGPDISGKVDVADFEEATLATSAVLNTLNQNLANKESDIQLLQAQVLELQNQISTLIGYYNELENIIG